MQRTFLLFAIAILLLTIAKPTSAEYQATQYLQTSSASRNTTNTHIVNISGEAQTFTGTLYGREGQRLGEANQPLSVDPTPSKGRLVVRAEDLEQLFQIQSWSGAGRLEITGTNPFEVMSKLTSDSGLEANVNCTRQQSVHNVEGFDSPNSTLVRLINTGNSTLTDIRGSMYDHDGQSIGSTNQQLATSIPAKSAIWLDRDDLSEIFGDTWNGEAHLEVLSPPSSLRLLNLNHVNFDNYANFSCYESAQVALSGSAMYRLTFIGEWTEENHPGAVPAGAHFTTLVGATHTDQITFWRLGEEATPGMENVAELGTTESFSDEVNLAISEGTAETLLTFVSPPISDSSMYEFEVTAGFPYLTLASMVAPSPDWFVGIDSLNLSSDGEWRDTIMLDLFVYDAGTEEGSNFSLDNLPTVPAETISRLEEAPFPAGGNRLGYIMLERIDN